MAGATRLSPIGIDGAKKFLDSCGKSASQDKVGFNVKPQFKKHMENPSSIFEVPGNMLRLMASRKTVQ